MSIGGVNFEGQQQYQSKNRTLRHVLNVASVGVGAGVTGLLLAKGITIANGVCGDRIAISNGSKVFSKAGSLYRHFERAGEKLFNDKTVIGKAIKRFVTGEMPSGGRLTKPDQIAAIIKKYKAVGAMGLFAMLAMLPPLLISIYNAGKINGDK